MYSMKPKTTSPTDEVSVPSPTATRLPRKWGANHSDTASRPRKHHNNFKQSADIREDRGVRQVKFEPKNRA